MGSVISAFYHGELHPNEHDYSKNDDFTILEESFQQDETWLMERLNSEEKALLSDLIQVHQAMKKLVSYESFRDGFILGVNIVMEACCGAAEVRDG